MPYAVSKWRQPIRLLQAQPRVHDAVPQAASIAAGPTAVAAELAFEHHQRRPVLEHLGRNAGDAGRKCGAAEAIQAPPCPGSTAQKREQREAVAIRRGPVD